MSSEKINKARYVTVGLDPELIAKLDKEAFDEHRSRSFIVERIVREFYTLDANTEKGVSHGR